MRLAEKLDRKGLKCAEPHTVLHCISAYIIVDSGQQTVYLNIAAVHSVL
jgi:hypothetical protein